MLRGIIYSVLSALGFSTLPVFAKLCYDAGFTSTQMLFYRFTFGALSIAVFLVLTGKLPVLMTSKANIVRIMLVAVCFFLPQAFFFVSSVKYISAVTTELIFYFYPTAVILISWAVFRKQLNRLHLIAAVTAFAGSAFVLYEAFSSNVNLVGIGFAFAAMMMFSTYIIITRNILDNIDAFALTFFFMLTASAVLFFITGAGVFHLTPYQLFLAVLIGIVPSSMSTILLYKALKEIGPSLTCIASSIEPVFTVILAHMLLKETTAAAQFIGMFMIIAGIILPVWGSAGKKSKPSVS